MSQVIVIDKMASSGSRKEPRIAYDNLAKQASSTSASSDHATVMAIYDDMTTVKWRPGVSGVSWVQFNSENADTGSGGDLPVIDCVGVSGCNWESSGTTISIKDENGSVIASASGLRDNQPLFLIFDDVTLESLRFEFTSSNSKLEVGEVFYSKSMKFPRNVKIGYMPGRWKFNDIITNGRTEANQFSNSTVRARGTEERFSIDFVPISFMEAQYRNFINDAKGLPVFFLWNQNERNQAVYGTWEASAPRFTSSFYSSIDLTIRGVA